MYLRERKDKKSQEVDKFVELQKLLRSCYSLLRTVLDWLLSLAEYLGILKWRQLVSTLVCVCVCVLHCIRA